MKVLRSLLTVAFLALPLHVFGSQITATHTAVNITTDSTLVSSGPRALLIIQNDSDTDMYCNVAGGAAVLGQGLRLLANGGAFGFDVAVPKGAIHCIHNGTGNKVLLVTEG